MKTHRLQAAFARKRESEHIRTERTKAVDSYYNHWGKQTTKYENWTAPEYYKQAEDNLKRSQEKKEKEEKLTQRREKLRKLLEEEKFTFEEQLQNLRPRSRNMSASVMEKIDQNFKEKQNEKRRLDLEAKLYGRLRHGRDDASLLYESKCNNQVLAKLNWLDKQIEDQVKRDQDANRIMEQSLRIQEEIRKTEQTHKERQAIRQNEIKEIRSLQEKHVTELKEREIEAESLKSEAQHLHIAIEQIDAELIQLETNSDLIFEEFLISNNLKNIKMIIRKRSEAFRKSLKSYIQILSRVNEICPNESPINRLISKLKLLMGSETQNLSKIECMYESEAKVNLQHFEGVWRRLNYEHRLELISLLKDLKNRLSNKLYENQIRQKDLINIRAAHLSSIENSNKQLKLLIKEEELSPRLVLNEKTRNLNDQQLRPIQKVSDSFLNLNLDCLSGNGAEVTSQPNTPISQLIDTHDSARGPKFGRKKIAWT